jgi:transcriptional regulator with XRE-family HTH domain
MSDNWGADLTRRIADEIKRLRGNNSGQWLSDRTADLGHRVSRSTISEIETGKRQTIAIDALIVLAAALEIAPIALIYPGPYTVDNRVEMLPGVDTRMIEAAQWFAGRLTPADNPRMEGFRRALKVLDLLEQRNAVMAGLAEVPPPPADESEPDMAAPQRNSIIAQFVDLQRQITALGGGDELVLLRDMVDKSLATGRDVRESEFMAGRRTTVHEDSVSIRGGTFIERDQLSVPSVPFVPVSEAPDDGG